MRTSILLTSILVALSFGACKKDKAENNTETPTEAEPSAAQPAVLFDAATAASEDGAKATATVASASGSNVAGEVTFTSSGDTVTIEAKFTGLTPGEHGFHVHETGDCSAPDATSAGGHFNPTDVPHGAPGSEPHHVGDLGNITANDEGVAEMKTEVPTSHLSLDSSAANNIVGKAVVVHGNADDLKSQPAGDAGPRVGCGVIAMQE